MYIIINEQSMESKHKIYMSKLSLKHKSQCFKTSISNNTKRITYIRQVERTTPVSSNDIS
ncbi:hypothetical protein Scep_009831 [Stephania cephalantha]|uniref:Uncharacterized protein n=1 Tax=Stephania cephalantha TaxID=152367 RepID=A0AAP0JUX9_9MAGN